MIPCIPISASLLIKPMEHGPIISMGNPFGTQSETQWKNQAGTDVEYNGEVYNLQDDMPETPTDRCLFSPCQYKSQGGNYTVSFSSGDIESDNSALWGAELLNPIAFDIWDINP